MKVKKYGICDKCGTQFTPLYEYDGRMLCKLNACYDEETEKDSGKVELDELRLDEYRNLVAGTKGVQVT